MRIIEPGPLATVQDEGRFGYRDRGVPACGAMDRQALRLGNLLVGNPPGAASIEITMGGFCGRFEGGACFALTGAEGEAKLNGRGLTSWRPHFAKEGDLLETRAPASGVRTYLAVQGGVDVPVVMGSRSTFLKGRLGGLEGRPLRRADLLVFGPAAPGGALAPLPELPAKLLPDYSKECVLRVLPGPQIGRISPRGLKTLFSSQYLISSRSDRMGSILLGPAVELECGGDIISDGAFPGAVQTPGDGQPVILGNDCQTTGGYVKAAAVIEADLGLAGQLGPGATVRFAEVSLDEARLAYLRNEYMLREFAARGSRSVTGG